MATVSMSKRREKGGDETAVRERILEAAFAAFMKSGYATASTLEIATRARVSKRELYALVGNKQEMLIACISERAKRFAGARRLARAARSRDPRAGAGFFRDAARARDNRSHGHCGIPTGDRRGGPGARGGASARLHRARDESCRLASNHGRAQASGLLAWPSCRTCRAVRRVALGQFDGQPAARRRRATELTRSRGTCPRRHSRVSATSSATEGTCA